MGDYLCLCTWVDGAAKEDELKPAIPNSEGFCGISEIERFMKKSQALAGQRF